MKISNFLMAFLCLNLSSFLAFAQESDKMFDCNSVLNRVTAASIDTSFTYSNSIPQGQSIDSTWLDNPELTVEFTSTGGCVLVNFNALAQILDNHIVFQVQLDGRPLLGHGPSGYLSPGIQERIISEDDEFDKVLNFVRLLRDEGVINVSDNKLNQIINSLGIYPRMLSYSFVDEVEDGDHTVSLFLGGCCGGGNTWINNPSLIVHYPSLDNTVNITNKIFDQPDGFLGQNVPNPASITTRIDYQIPINAQAARIVIFDLSSGTEVMSLPIFTKGSGSLIIDRAKLVPGTYGYFLIVDKKIIESRKMVWVD